MENIQPFDTSQYTNKDGIKVLVEFFIAEKMKDCSENQATAKENQKLELVNIADLNKYNFLPGSLATITKLQNT